MEVILGSRDACAAYSEGLNVVWDTLDGTAVKYPEELTSRGDLYLSPIHLRDIIFERRKRRQ